MKEVENKSISTLEGDIFEATVKLNSARVILEKLTNDYGFSEELAPTYGGVCDWFTKRGERTKQETNSATWIGDYEYILTMLFVISDQVYDSYKLLGRSQGVATEAIVKGKPSRPQIENAKESA